MSNQTKAGLITVGILGIGALALTAMQWIVEYFTREEIVNTLVLGICVFLVWSMYQLILTRLEYDERLEKLNESIKKPAVDQ